MKFISAEQSLFAQRHIRNRRYAGGGSGAEERPGISGSQWIPWLAGGGLWAGFWQTVVDHPDEGGADMTALVFRRNRAEGRVVGLPSTGADAPPTGAGGSPTGPGMPPTGPAGSPTDLGGPPTGPGGPPTGLGGSPTGLGGSPTGLGGPPTGLGGPPTGLGGLPMA
jgi:hypothetical protein